MNNYGTNIYRLLTLSLLYAALLFLCGCAGRGSGNAAKSAVGMKNMAGVSGARLQPPAIPSALTDPQQRAEYLAENYWQHYDFADKTLISNADYTEQAFVDFIYLLSNVSEAAVRSAVGKLIGNAAADPAMFDHFTELAEQYLYDPNSPMRNEELYIPFLEQIIALPSVDSLLKIRPRHQLAMALKNRPGTVAADFAYTTASGKTGRLSNMQGYYTLLFFYDPDCYDCKRVKQYIADSPVFGSLVGGQEGKQLSVLAVYTDGHFDAWRAHLPDMPPAWTVGYDKGQALRGKELYDLKAIPTLYLLDKDKRILLKDAPVEQIKAWLAQNTPKYPPFK